MVSDDYPITFCNNSYYAGILQDLYAGKEGEMVMFLQFRYFSYVLSGFHPKLSNILQEIAYDGLKHQNLLAYAIQMTSGNPIYKSDKWFSGDQIEYIRETKKILSLSLKSKERSIINYKFAISKIDNLQIKSLLSSILFEEERHRQQLKNLISEIKS